MKLENMTLPFSFFGEWKDQKDSKKVLSPSRKDDLTRGIFRELSKPRLRKPAKLKTCLLFTF